MRFKRDQTSLARKTAFLLPVENDPTAMAEALISRPLLNANKLTYVFSSSSKHGPSDLVHIEMRSDLTVAECEVYDDPSVQFNTGLHRSMLVSLAI